jgi:hypothetical protein
MLDTFSSSHETQCDQLTANIRSQLAARAGQLQQLADAVGQIVSVQNESLTTLTDISATQESVDREWLAAYGGLCNQTATDADKLSRELNENQLGPLLATLSQQLDQQSRQLISLQDTIRVDITALLRTFSSFTSDLGARMAMVRGAVDSFAAGTAAAIEDLSRENQAIQASESDFKTVLEDMMAKYLLHARKVTASTVAMAAASQNCSRLTEQLVSTVQAAGEAVEAGQRDMEASTEEQAGQAVTRLTEDIQHCQDVIVSLKSTSATVGETVSAYVTVSQEKMAGFEVAAKASLEQAEAAKEAYLEKFGSNLAGTTARLTADAALITSGIESNILSDKQVPVQ